MQRVNKDKIWIKPLTGFKQFCELRNKIKAQESEILITGLAEQAKCHMLASLLHPVSSSCLYITHSERNAKRIIEELEFFFPGKVMNFPAREAFFYSTQASSNEVSCQRLKALLKLLQNESVVVVATYDALLNLQTDMETIKYSVFTLKVGDICEISSLTEKLATSGYERVDIVEGAGQFAVRGGILDYFPPIEDKPYRLEFFDDVIDSIREFDTTTQRSIEKVTEALITPARELVLTKNSLKTAERSINEFYHNFINKLGTQDKNTLKRIKEKTSEILEYIAEEFYTPQMDSFFNFFYPERISAIDYLAKNSYVIFDEPAKIAEYANGFSSQFVEHFKDLLEQGDCLPEQAGVVLSLEDLFAKARQKNVILLESLRSHNLHHPNEFNFNTKSLTSYQGNLYALSEKLNALREQKYSILTVLSSQKRVEAFVSALLDNGVEALIQDSDAADFPPGKLYVTVGSLTAGFEYTDARFLIVSEHEIYGSAKKKSKGKSAQKKLFSYTDFKVGDYVVHENHGIGMYVGLETLIIDGRKRDYLNIRYAGTDKLYVPTDQLDFIQPYALVDDLAPKLSKLGSAEWQKTKARVNESVKKLAIDLLKLYAEREAAKGHRFGRDTDWQKDFEMAFPFEETADQLTAVEDIKRDMESGRVMDRLLCGDVGYGKTEVAARAAFKAVLDNKQVAVLSPTTILAQQHFNTLSRRFEKFPFKVDVLSRFRNQTQQKATIKSLNEGSVDVIVGTHRLLGKDIKFKDLGLLIVDEEQRFGVSHKETLKEIKKNVDVLTLTATPIPRTLHMSLSGIRDISVIETPPEGRYTVQTYVVSYDDNLIRDAILKEISRKGQVYFVYNRVRSMESMSERLRNLVPDVRIAMAHGQMPENMLEEVMIEFYNKSYDVLLCSSIIENGLDIPNANTLIVYDCDHFGLSQLYQLRGRVGRSSRRAYAYFVYRKDKILSETAEKRLRTIKEFTEFGAGFKIALRDMEIRGAGNIMGAEQHGHMVAVGYDMYYRLLKTALAELKGESAQKIEPLIDIKINAHIDDEYITDEAQRIGIYKRIASIECGEDKNNVEEELEDRFGDPPKAVRNLVDIAFIKALGMKIGVSEILHEGRKVRIKLLQDSFNPRRMMTLINENRGNIDYLSSNPPILAVKLKNEQPETAITQAKEILIKMEKLTSMKDTAIQAK